MAISNSASPELIWGLEGPEEDHQLHHCCWTGRVGEREEEDKVGYTNIDYNQSDNTPPCVFGRM